MPTTLIDDLNQKTNELKTQTTKIDFLTSEQRKEITNIIEQIRQEAIYYDKYKEESEQNGKYDNFELAGIFFTFLEYNQQVNRVKEIFTDLKQKVSKEEQAKVEMVEKNTLTIIEKLTQGVDYWEDIELREYSEWLWKELKNSWSAEDTHVELANDVVRMAKEQNDKETKELMEEIADKAREIEEKTLLLDEATEENERNCALIKQLRQQLKENSELLDEANEELERKDKKFKEEIKNRDNKIEDLTRKLSFAIKELPSLPKKSLNKLKALKAKMKTKSQQLIEKVKQQSQELVARIEIRTK